MLLEFTDNCEILSIVQIIPWLTSDALVHFFNLTAPDLGPILSKDDSKINFCIKAKKCQVQLLVNIDLFL